MEKQIDVIFAGVFITLIIADLVILIFPSFFEYIMERLLYILTKLLYIFNQKK